MKKRHQPSKIQSLRVRSLEASLGYSWFLFLPVFEQYLGLLALRSADSRGKKSLVHLILHTTTVIGPFRVTLKVLLGLLQDNGWTKYSF